MRRSLVYFLIFLSYSCFSTVQSADERDQELHKTSLITQNDEIVALGNPSPNAPKAPFWTKRRVITASSGMIICLTTAIGTYVLYNKLIDQKTDGIRQDAINMFMNQSNITGSDYWGTTMPYDRDDKDGGPLPSHFRECLSLPSRALCSYWNDCRSLDPNDTSSCIFNCNATKPNQHENVLVHCSLLDTISIFNKYCGCQVRYWYDLAQQAYQQKTPENRTLVCTPNQDNLSLCCGHVSYDSGYVPHADGLYFRFVYGNASDAGETAVQSFMNNTKAYAHQKATVFSAVGESIGLFLFLITFIDYFFF